MFNNLIKIYTKKGDSGETSLFGGSRISKDSVQVEAYGSVDETSSFLGVSRSLMDDINIKNIIYEIQSKLIIISAHLASDENGKNKLKHKIEKKDIQYLEEIIDRYSKELLPISEFIISGENFKSSTLHVARTVMRRTERRVVALNNAEENILKYLNRSSDVLFILARYLEDSTVVEKIASIVQKKIKSTTTTLSLEEAKFLLSLGEKKAKELKKDFTLSIVDSFGNLILQQRMDNAILASIDISQKKAYTAITLKIDTDSLGKLVQPGHPFYGLQNNSKYIVFGGGILIKKDDNILGAIGVSGGSVTEDIAVAKACLEGV